MSEIGTVGVVGAGTMGHGIAQVAAQAGFAVRLVDLSPEALAKGLAAIGGSLGKLAAKGRLTAEEAAAARARITGGTDLAALADADLVVEAVVERLEVKTGVFRQLDALCAPAAILASNTSSISITRLAAATGRPGQVIGMHFMNPVPLMPLVEVIRGLDTSDATYARVEAASRAMGKTPVEAHDYPGFISNRVLMPMINEAICCLHEGVGTAEAIDAVMKLGMNHPMGPLTLADLIGLDVCLDILRVLHDGFGDPKYRPSPLLVKMVDAGRLGRKSGQGFYTY
ncbi:MAG: 3-hydroxybutyryl-CoA dehydrogenase [Acidobacteria bacterium]|jgi:3-hydroxybutyryl-CoA dehydrogenase|nr:3-hydroxybutyryl-CoA dehydrogenase [Thermoanaerobaculia bacterium]NLN12282.1 3-hydroxybutyryl-CoA dehydrogenase [Acidobacteriota bacterium]MBP7812219.1 3-hydroxybutyryl-CoA dehydrogenase [Thermoanaerobaculia bacterium]MBP8845402.1 3-hydroxybutyryl-CoA dehydrogenase [Thermoanaerobaculia bacterium]HNU82470.1 3-hydroxybutyryl-CoA dehydrogenase [Thermoanaerobaculia bacterium]